MKVSKTSNRIVVGDFVEFPCPGNLKVKIVRSMHDRKTAKTYSDAESGFMGP